MNKKRKPSKIVNMLFLVFAAACFTYYLANGVLIRFGQSILWIWPVMGAACVMRFIMVARIIKTGKPSPIPKFLLHIAHALLAILLICFIVIEGIILSAAFTSPREDADAVIVLGAKVNGTKPSGALYNRITCAYEYLRNNPNAVCVASGGQGEDEGISEAQCIYNELTDRGIDGNRILLEEKSTDTIENIQYSLSMLANGERNIVIITNNFHVYRALKIAREADAEREYSALSVATSFISFPHYMVREFASVVVGALKGF